MIEEFYPQLNELRQLMLSLEIINSDEIKLQILLKEACQDSGNIGGCWLAKHLQACCHLF